MKAFTLIETLIAVTILTLAVGGPLFTASRALVAAQSARDQLTAAYLAQEGIEYVRAMRDNAYLVAAATPSESLSEDAWSEFLTGNSDNSVSACMAVNEEVPCTLDPSKQEGNKLEPCEGGCSNLYLSNSNTYTQQSVGTQTPFVRSVSVQISASSPLSTEARVTSRVNWNFRGRTHIVTVTDTLTPWQ